MAVNDLICPRCERPVGMHVDGECQGKRLSRRFFLGALGSVFASAALAKVMLNVAPVDMASGPDYTAIQVFAPHVHQGKAIILDHNFHPATLADDILKICRQTGRTVIGKVDGVVVAVAAPDQNVKVAPPRGLFNPETDLAGTYPGVRGDYPFRRKL